MNMQLQNGIGIRRGEKQGAIYKNNSISHLDCFSEEVTFRLQPKHWKE